MKNQNGSPLTSLTSPTTPTTPIRRDFHCQADSLSMLPGVHDLLTVLLPGATWGRPRQKGVP